MPLPSMESHFRDVFIPNLQLVITKPQINFKKYRCSLELIEKVLNPGQWVLVLYSYLIELLIINAHL